MMTSLKKIGIYYLIRFIKSSNVIETNCIIVNVPYPSERFFNVPIQHTILKDCIFSYKQNLVTMFNTANDSSRKIVIKGRKTRKFLPI